ncbi:MAG: 50S ribosomal protein L4 [Pseudomonadota bacterium]
MELQLTGGQGSVDISDTTFGREYNEALVHQLVVAYMAKGRAGSKAQKTRSDVSGGGIKPWRQKGTGRARAGTIRSPIWRGGGRAFAARPRNFEQKVNRKAYRAGMRSILSELVRQDRLHVVESVAVAEPKTKALLAWLAGVDVAADCAIIVGAAPDALVLAARNLPHVEVLEAKAVNPVSLLRNARVVIDTAALTHIEEAWQ